VAQITPLLPLLVSLFHFPHLRAPFPVLINRAFKADINVPLRNRVGSTATGAATATRAHFRLEMDGVALHDKCLVECFRLFSAISAKKDSSTGQKELFSTFRAKPDGGVVHQRATLTNFRLMYLLGLHHFVRYLPIGIRGM
jgi:hypothetical protein